MHMTKVWTVALVFPFILQLQACAGGGDSGDVADLTSIDTGRGGEEAVVPECILDGDCDDGDFCTVNSCSEGVCVQDPRDCDDLQYCTGVESCDSDAGQCVSADVPVVDDGLDCTLDECNDELDAVTHLGDSTLCDDLDPCTDDMCSEATGCESTFNEAGCDDGDPCTIDDTCGAGTCAGSALVCDDQLFCNGVESCDTETGECVPGEAPVPDDGLDCTEDSCDEGLGAVVNDPVDTACDDQDPCSDDWCDPDEGCSHDHNVEPCDDGLACTVDDVCFQGNCAGYSKECDDALFCNGLESCDDDTGECLAGYAPPVDDSIDCTIDQCDDDLDEVVHVPVDADCDDGDICTDDICDPGDGCVLEFNTNPCTDADPCTVLDQCLDGLCAGQPKECDDAVFCNGEESCDPVTGVCLGGEPPDPSDGIDCTEDSCDDVDGLLVNTPVDLACDDGNPCTDDACDPAEGCQNVDNTASCDDLDPCTEEDLCVDGACGGTPKDCDDQLFCNGQEACDPATGDCLVGIPPDKGDQIPCTLDTCDEETDSIAHAPDHTKCGDGNVCTDDTCDPIEGCLHGNNTVECDDGLACTLSDACGDGLCAGEPKVCTNSLYCDGLETCASEVGECVSGELPVTDDLVGCTVDICDEDADQVLHVADPTLCDDSNGCTDDSCELELDCVFSPNTLPCDDNEVCTDGDVCGAGECQPGPWACEDCTNDFDDNADGDTDCCDSICEEHPVCQVEIACGDDSDNDCDGVTDCADLDCLGSVACGPYPQPGDLVITEILQDPDAVGDSFGEWFEVHNASADTFDLRFMEVTDDGNNSFIVAEALVIGPGEQLVFGRKGDAEVNGGVDVDYVYSNFLLSNADDEIRLTLNGVEVDLVTYDGGPIFPDPTGAAMQLDPSATTGDGNDVGGNWCVSRTPVTEEEGADLGTPGQPNIPCHEVDCEDNVDDDFDGAPDCDDSDCVALEGCGDADEDGVYNRDELCPGWDDAVDDDEDGNPDGCEIDWAGQVIPPSGSDWEISEPLHVEVEVLMTDVTSVAGGDEGITGTMRYLVSGKNDWVEVSMTHVAEGSGGVDVYRGTVPALSVVPGLALTAEIVLSYETTNGITYGYNNDAILDLGGEPGPFTYFATGQAPAPVEGELVITEILKNPEHVPDNVGEWFEVYVAADHVVDLKGVRLADSGTNSHNVMVSVYGEPEAYLVLGNNGVFGENGQVSMAYTYEGFALGNDDDEVLLFNGDLLIDGVSYDAGVLFPDKAGAALSLTGDILDSAGNDDGDNWCDAVDSFGAGDLGTPGEPNPMCE